MRATRTNRDALAYLGAPTWAEEPAPVLRLIRKYADVDDPAGHVEALAAGAAQLARQVSERLNPDERPAFAELLGLARATARMKEDHSFWIEQQSTGAVRRVCVEFGRRLAAIGLLTAPAEWCRPERKKGLIAPDWQRPARRSRQGLHRYAAMLYVYPHSDGSATATCDDRKEFSLVLARRCEKNFRTSRIRWPLHTVGG